MANFGEGKLVRGRKRHKCDGCLGPIPLGEEHFNYRGVYDGCWQNWRMHKECFEQLDADSASEYGYEFMPGCFDMPERVRAALEGK